MHCRRQYNLCLRVGAVPSHVAAVAARRGGRPPAAGAAGPLASMLPPDRDDAALAGLGHGMGVHGCFRVLHIWLDPRGIVGPHGRVQGEAGVARGRPVPAVGTTLAEPRVSSGGLCVSAAQGCAASALATEAGNCTLCDWGRLAV